jgi:amino acid adenylation domain-containing protein
MVFLIHQAVDKAAERVPDNEALRCYEQSLTYAELAQKSNSLAQTLIQRGVKRGDRVGIYLPKSLESGLAIYGIMKAGAAYVPLDALAPVTRISYAVRDCGIRQLITEASMANHLRQILADGVELDCLIGPPHPLQDVAVDCIPWHEVFDAPDSHPPEVGTIEQDLAYVMYTSGSTGSPKGIMHTHHSGLSYAKWAADAYRLNPQDRIANHSPLHFDISTYDFFAGAVAGSTVVVIPEEYTKLPASFSQLLASERISVIFTVPLAYIQLLLRGAIDQRDLSALRWIVYGGEPFPVKHLRALMEKLPNARFSNIYGPAEVNGVTFYHVPPLPPDWNEPIPIGRVCPFAQALVVDEDDQPVRQGEAGELLIRSPSMMQGYWGRPDLNKQAFLRRPVFADFEEVFYRTGDLVRRLPDGNLLFLGRKDRQVKIRGYRVELDEIEAALLSHEGIDEVAVFSVPDVEGSQKIEAAAILKAEATTSAEELGQFLSDVLPSYAVPHKIKVVQTFPRTTSGKIDRRELRQRSMRDEAQAAYS